MKTIEALPNNIYSVSEDFVKKLESGQIQIKWYSNILNWRVVGRTGDGFNVIFK